MDLEAIKAVSKSIDAFTLDFHKNVAKTKPGENLVCSALSAHVVLAMAAYGAEGKTAEEMNAALHLNDSKMLEGFSNFIDSLNDVKEVILKIANKIYAAEKLTIKEAFQKITESSFRSQCERVDFSKNVETVDLINNWCAEKTNDKIKNLLQPSDVNSNTGMVLLNAVYFKGNWRDKFNEKHTNLKKFHLNKSATIDVPTMFIEKKFHYNISDALNAQYVGIPYQNEDLLMLVVIPNEIDGLESVEQNLEKLDLNYESDFVDMYKTKIRLHLPKFKIESTLNLNQILEELGMKEMFDPKLANFNGISESDLSVSKVVQKAFIEVNEEGSEAAAATAAIMMMRCMPMPPPEVHVDRPFIYKIVDKKRNVTLFSGRIVDPSKN